MKHEKGNNAGQKGTDRNYSLFLNGFLAVLFIAALIFLTVKYGPSFTKLVKNPREFRELLVSYGPAGIFVFIFFQMSQVVIAAIPGEFVQIAGGYIYGTFFGTVYSLVGIVCGAAIAFFIARLLGLNLVKHLAPQKGFEKFNFIVNQPKVEVTLFLLFLIPGIPKDTLVYLAGLTPIKPLPFFLIFTIARFPGILAASYIGMHVQEQNYTRVIVVVTIACILFLVGLLKKDVIIHKLHGILKRDS